MNRPLHSIPVAITTGRSLEDTLETEQQRALNTTPINPTGSPGIAAGLLPIQPKPKIIKKRWSTSY